MTYIRTLWEDIIKVTGVPLNQVGDQGWRVVNVDQERNSGYAALLDI